MKPRGISRVVGTVVLAIGLGLGTLTACSGQGASAQCDGTSSCTITFDRSADQAQIDILGVTVKLVSADDSAVTLSIADRQVTIQKGGGVKVGNINVAVDQITQDEIVVKATRS